MKVLNTAVFGCGRVSRFHARAYLELKQTNFVGGVDSDSKQRSIFTDTYHLPCYAHLDELLNHHAVDLISICTPSNKHFEHASKCIKRGVNVIIEKPVCLKLQDGQRLKELLKHQPAIVSTCFQNRFNAPVELLLKHVHDQKFGQIYHVGVSVRWFRSPEYYIDHWHASMIRSGGGALMTQAIHHLDLLHQILGYPQEIQGYSCSLREYSDVEDIISFVMRYPHALASFEATTVAASKDFEASITVQAEHGTIKIGGTSLNKIEYGMLHGEPLTHELDEEDPISVYGTSHIRLIEDVVNSIIQIGKPRVSLDDGINAVSFVQDVYKSIKPFQF